jgi:hypothetical protein
MISPIRPFIVREGVWYSALSDYLDRYPVPSTTIADTDYTWPPDDYELGEEFHYE